MGIIINMKFNLLWSTALAYTYNVDMMQSSMREVGQRNVVLEKDTETVDLKFANWNGNGYSWIGNMDGQNVRLVNRETVTTIGLNGGKQNDIWSVMGVKVG